MVDVLNSQTEFLETKKDLKNANYDFILETLKLKASAGILSKADVVEINSWLQQS